MTNKKTNYGGTLRFGVLLSIGLIFFGVMFVLHLPTRKGGIISTSGGVEFTHSDWLSSKEKPAPTISRIALDPVDFMIVDNDSDVPIALEFEGVPNGDYVPARQQCSIRVVGQEVRMDCEPTPVIGGEFHHQPSFCKSFPDHCTPEENEDAKKFRTDALFQWPEKATKEPKK